MKSAGDAISTLIRKRSFREGMARCDAQSMLPQIVESRLDQPATRKIGRCHRSTATGRFRFTFTNTMCLPPGSNDANAWYI